MGLRPTPRYLQSYSHTSYGQSELRGATSNFCRTSLHLAFVSAGLLTRNFQGIFRKFFYKIVPISSIIKFEPLQISPTRTLVEPYNRISPGQLHFTGLLAFPDSHAVPPVAVFWIRLYLINKAFYCSSGSWVVLIAITLAQYLSFPLRGFTLSVAIRVRSTIHRYPCFVPCRASLRYFSA